MKPFPVMLPFFALVLPVQAQVTDQDLAKIKTLVDTFTEQASILDQTPGFELNVAAPTPGVAILRGFNPQGNDQIQFSMDPSRAADWQRLSAVLKGRLKWIKARPYTQTAAIWNSESLAGACGLLRPDGWLQMPAYAFGARTRKAGDPAGSPRKTGQGICLDKGDPIPSGLVVPQGWSALSPYQRGAALLAWARSGMADQMQERLGSAYLCQVDGTALSIRPADTETKEDGGAPAAPAAEGTDGSASSSASSTSAGGAAAAETKDRSVPLAASGKGVRAKIDAWQQANKEGNVVLLLGAQGDDRADRYARRGALVVLLDSRSPNDAVFPSLQVDFNDLSQLSDLGQALGGCFDEITFDDGVIYGTNWTLDHLRAINALLKEGGTFIAPRRTWNAATMSGKEMAVTGDLDRDLKTLVDQTVPVRQGIFISELKIPANGGPVRTRSQLDPTLKAEYQKEQDTHFSPPVEADLAQVFAKVERVTLQPWYREVPTASPMWSCTKGTTSTGKK